MTAPAAPPAPDETPGEVLVVTGMSGAGRTTAANALEDLGWFVVDNMPPALLPPMVELALQGRTEHSRDLQIAAVTDVRGGEYFGDLQQALTALERFGIRARMLFLEADDETIVRRFEASRRPHPLQGDGRLVDGIAAERTLLADLRESADLLVDTSRLNVHQLRNRIEADLGEVGAQRVQVTVMSFGFKYGLPVDADFVVDCRFLPNPHWEPELRPLTGEDARVARFVLEQPLARPFLQAFEDALRVVLEGYRTENKRFVTIAVGCTGGKHRSVAVADEIARSVAADDLSVKVVHRDIGRE